VFPEKELFARGDFAAGTNQALPLIGISTELTSQQDLNASAKEVMGRRIRRTKRLRFEASAAAVKASGKHAGVVEYY
jgi:hypothetical protein